ncbi:MAG: ATP-dependent sacrificial sulfur transferase LarE [Asgard group archaeon]|nr:ATP-dependent sacrificial sulfur transferase LarE [Asgard group archaeon]
MNKNQISIKLEKLQIILKSLKKVIIAFSGGVDSSFLAKIAYDVLGNNASAVTIDAPQLPDDELNEAKTIASEIGITHYIIPRELVENSWFETNPDNRCYICKKNNLDLIANFCKEKKITGQLLEGSNFDDLDDYRPGYQAVKELNVQSPLIETQLTKKDIRNLAKQLDLSCWEKPASPCLATRFPFGEKITEEKLKMVFKSEQYLKSLGLTDLRVRVHDKIARIETDKAFFDVLLKNSVQISEKFKDLGFSFVTIDLEGYKKGSMNRSKK